MSNVRKCVCVCGGGGVVGEIIYVVRFHGLSPRDVSVAWQQRKPSLKRIHVVKSRAGGGGGVRGGRGAGGGGALRVGLITTL